MRNKKQVVPETGIEPVRLVKGRRILSPLCLPISPLGQVIRMRKADASFKFIEEPGSVLGVDVQTWEHEKQRRGF